MKERIKELAEQANFTEQNIKDLSPGFEKFAELVWKEAYEEGHDVGVDVGFEAGHNASFTEQNFGVKE